MDQQQFSLEQYEPGQLKYLFSFSIQEQLVDVSVKNATLLKIYCFVFWLSLKMKWNKKPPRLRQMQVLLQSFKWDEMARWLE